MATTKLASMHAILILTARISFRATLAIVASSFIFTCFHPYCLGSFAGTDIGSLVHGLYCINQVFGHDGTCKYFQALLTHPLHYINRARMGSALRTGSLC